MSGHKPSNATKNALLRFDAFIDGVALTQALSCDEDAPTPSWDVICAAMNDTALVPSKVCAGFPRSLGYFARTSIFLRAACNPAPVDGRHIVELFVRQYRSGAWSIEGCDVVAVLMGAIRVNCCELARAMVQTLQDDPTTRRAVTIALLRKASRLVVECEHDNPAMLEAVALRLAGDRIAFVLDVFSELDAANLFTGVVVVPGHAYENTMHSALWLAVVRNRPRLCRRLFRAAIVRNVAVDVDGTIPQTIFAELAAVPALQYTANDTRLVELAYWDAISRGRVEIVRDALWAPPLRHLLRTTAAGGLRHRCAHDSAFPLPKGMSGASAKHAPGALAALELHLREYTTRHLDNMPLFIYRTVHRVHQISAETGAPVSLGDIPRLIVSPTTWQKACLADGAWSDAVFDATMPTTRLVKLVTNACRAASPAMLRRVLEIARPRLDAIVAEIRWPPPSSGHHNGTCHAVERVAVFLDELRHCPASARPTALIDRLHLTTRDCSSRCGTTADTFKALVELAEPLFGAEPLVRRWFLLRLDKLYYNYVEILGAFIPCIRRCPPLACLDVAWQLCMYETRLARLLIDANVQLPIAQLARVIVSAHPDQPYTRQTIVELVEHSIASGGEVAPDEQWRLLCEFLRVNTDLSRVLVSHLVTARAWTVDEPRRVLVSLFPTYHPLIEQLADPRPTKRARASPP